MPEGIKGFQKGNTIGQVGRPKKLKTIVKDWIKEHPMAVAELMHVLYEKGIEGDRESAMYVIDRIQGKPKASTVVELEGADMIGVEAVKRIMEFIATREREVKLIGGGDAIQKQD